MAPTIIPAFAKRQAGKVRKYIRARAQHEYNEMSLKLETSLWQSTDYIKNSTLVRVYTDLGKMFNIYKKSKARKAAADVPSKIQIHSSNRGRIEKDKNFQLNQQIRKIRSAEIERKRQLILVEQKRQAWVHTASGRPLSHVDCNVSKKRSDTDFYMPKVHYNLSEAQPETSYMELVRSLHPASDDHKERHKRATAALGYILGSERMHTGVGLPSGHSGVTEDPFLFKYYQNKNVDDTINLHREYQLKQRRQWEEHQVWAYEQEVICMERLYAYEAACNVYDTRVAKLAQFGPKLDIEITKLLAAFNNGDMASLEQAITALINEVLELVGGIFEEMKDEIPLESLGADILKDAWPLANINKVLETFNVPIMSCFNDTYQAALGYMLQGLRAICQPISSAVPIINPFGEPLSQPFVAAPIPVNFETYAASVQRKQPDVPVSEGPNTGKNYSISADLLRADNPTPGGQPQVPNIVVTPPTVQSGGAPSGSGSSLNDNKASVINAYTGTIVLEFQDNLTNLVKTGSINTTRRKDLEQVLERLHSDAAGATGFLTDNDSYTMKVEIEHLVYLLSSLRDTKEKNKKTTKDCVALAKKVLKLWA